VSGRGNGKNFLDVTSYGDWYFIISQAWFKIRKIYRHSNERTGMKYLLLIILLMAVLMTAGCVVQNNNPPVTPTPQIVYVTVLVTPTQTSIVTTPLVTTTIPLTITSTIQTLNTAQVVGNSVPGKVTVYFFYGKEWQAGHRVRYARLDSDRREMDLKTIISPFLKDLVHYPAFLAHLLRKITHQY